MKDDEEDIYREHNFAGTCVCVDCEDYRNDIK